MNVATEMLCYRLTWVICEWKQTTLKRYTLWHHLYCYIELAALDVAIWHPNYGVASCSNYGGSHWMCLVVIMTQTLPLSQTTINNGFDLSSQPSQPPQSSHLTTKLHPPTHREVDRWTWGCKFYLANTPTIEKGELRRSSSSSSYCSFISHL